MKQQKKLTESKDIIQTNVGGDAHINPHCEGTTQKHGITLISLVITVVVLLILAGVAISIVVSPEGLFGQAENAAEKWNNRVVEENVNVQNQIDLINTLGANQEPSEKAKGEFYQNGGSIEVKFVDKNNAIINEPLAPILGTGMEAIKWNGAEWVTTSIDDDEWYNYNQSKWANAKTTDGSMWVWIPRYAYEITYNVTPYTSYSVIQTVTVTEQQFQDTVDEKVHEINTDEGAWPAYPVEDEALAQKTGSYKYVLYEKNAEGGYTEKFYGPSAGFSTQKQITGYSNSKGIVNVSGEIIANLEDGVETSGKYIVHPAFGTNLDLGGWSEPISGIWVAKYEMSEESGNIVSKPGVSSIYASIIGNMYTKCFNYNRENESHLMKNSEWGAVAYLSYSQYGTNGIEIDINGSDSRITGTGGATASSTRNETGVYDLSGGGWEYVAAYDKLGGNNLNVYGSSFATGTSTKYATAYSNGTDNYNGKDIMLNVGKTGDATREMVGTYYYTWNYDYADCVCIDYCFPLRGGYHAYGTMTGLFFSMGASSENYGAYRVVLVPSQD